MAEGCQDEKEYGELVDELAAPIDPQETSREQAMLNQLLGRP